MAEAWVTLATNDSYALGALVLGHSLRQVGTTRKLVIMVTPAVTPGLRSLLQGVFDALAPVDVLDSNDQENLLLTQRPDLGITFTKLHCWRLTDFTKCVFLDADTLFLQNADELFDREELSAAPDVGWPDCFNSGVFVFKPSLETYRALLQFAVSHGSFDGGDQGLLNMYFHDWSQKETRFRLPFIYNMTTSVSYGYAPALKQFGKDVKIVHYIGSVKPWHHGYNVTTGSIYYRNDSGHGRDHVEQWWHHFGQSVYPQIKPTEFLHLLEIIGTLDMLYLPAIPGPTSGSERHTDLPPLTKDLLYPGKSGVHLPVFVPPTSTVRTVDVAPILAVSDFASAEVNRDSQSPFYVIPKRSNPDPEDIPLPVVAKKSSPDVAAPASVVEDVNTDHHSVPVIDQPDLPQAFRELQLVAGAKGDERAHQQRFEAGRIDYTGEDSFSNIQQWLDKSLEGEQPK